MSGGAAFCPVRQVRAVGGDARVFPVAIHFHGEFDRQPDPWPGYINIAGLTCGRALLGRSSPHGRDTVAHVRGSFTPCFATESHAWRTQGPVSFRAFFLPYAEVDAMAAERMPGGTLADDRFDTVLALPRLERIEVALEMAAAQGPLSAMELSAWRLLIIEVLLSAGAPRPAPRTVPLTPAQVDRAVDFMVAHLADNPGLATVAEELGLTPWGFARAFRAATGEPPHRRLNALRLDEARQRLARGDEGIAAVAAACGFSSQAHMTTAFSAAFGVTPGAWRDAVRPAWRRTAAQGDVTPRGA